MNPPIDLSITYPRMPVTFHTIDCCARDQTILSTTNNENAVLYEEFIESDDDEFKPAKKGASFVQKNDHSGKEYLIHLFGKTNSGAAIRCDVRGFKPFFYIRCPDSQTKAKRAIEDYLDRHIKFPRVRASIKVTLCQRKELFGFTQDKLVPMLQLTMPCLAVFRDVKNMFLNSHSEPELKELINSFNIVCYIFNLFSSQMDIKEDV